MLKSESQRWVSLDQKDMFGGPAQPDMFGVPAPKAYVPDPRHVRNRLSDLLAQLKAADTWPWEPVMVRLHRDRTVPYLCALLSEEEAAQWRLDFQREMARLDPVAQD